MENKMISLFKKCSKCGRTLPFFMFRKISKGGQEAGMPSRDYKCDDCRKEYMRNYLRTYMRTYRKKGKK